MKRPLACTSLVFVMVLFLLQKMGAIGLIKEPVAPRLSKRSVMASFGQGDTVIICGQIADYSTDDKYGKTTTELNLKNIQILPHKEALTKDINISDNISESDFISQFQTIGTKRQRILVYLQDEFAPVIGSYVIVSGQMSYFNPATNPGEFDAYRFYTNRGYLFAVKKGQVINVTASGNRLMQGLKLFRLRQEAYLEEYLPDGNDKIMAAMLFGNKSGMDEETKELYRKNGIAHILAISGLHISLLGMSVYKVLLHLPMPKSCILIISGTFLVLYCLMVGITASAFRALVMFSFFLVSKWLKRSYDMITAMGFSAMVWLMLYPGYLFDCGFQLSYAAIMGIGIVLPVLTEITNSLKIKWLRKIIAVFLPSLSVNLMTAPILIYHYHELSFFSIALNLIVIPLMAPLLLCGVGMLALADLFGAVSSIPAGLCAVPVNGILWIYEMGCRLLELFPIGRKNIAALSLGELFLYYSILIAMTILVKRKSHFYQFVFPMVCIFMLVIPQKHDFAVWTLDVGQGDCTVIFTDEGNVFVIDCGSTSKYNVGEKILIPFLKYHGVDTVDGIIITHPDEDHMNGTLELMELQDEENLKIAGLYLYEKGLENEPQEWKEVLDTAKGQNIPVCGIGQGDILQTETFSIKCLYPLEWQTELTGNASSLVLKAECGEFCGIFTGDMEAEGEGFLLQESGMDGKTCGHEKCDLLKVAHHGSSTSTGSRFLQWVDPKYAVISCGENNRYGHPHKEVIDRLEGEDIPYWITYKTGAVKWTTGIPRPWLQSGP